MRGRTGVGIEATLLLSLTPTRPPPPKRHYLGYQLACRFLQKWPDLQVLQRVRPATLRQFFYGHHCWLYRSALFLSERKWFSLSTFGALLRAAFFSSRAVPNPAFST